MMKTILVAFGILTGGLALSSDLLTWQACVNETALGNAELQSARESLRSSEFSQISAYSVLLPQVNGSLGYSQSNSSGGSGTADSSGAYSASLSVTETLFSGFQDWARIGQAAANATVSGANLKTIKAKVSYDLKTGYAGLVYAQESVRLQKDIVHRREENLRLVELRFDGGRENKGSVLLSRAYLSQANLEALQARNDVRIAQSQLAKVLGRDEESGLSVGEDLPLANPPSESGGEPDMKKIATETPDHLQVAAQEESAEAGITLARAGFFPTLSLTGSAGKQGTEWFPSGDRWSVGVNLTLPVFSGGKDYFGTKGATASYAAASANRQSTDRQLLVKLQQAYTGFIEAGEKVKVDDNFVLAAKMRSEIGRNKYNNGLISFEEWDLIENDLIQRQKTALNSKRDRVAAEATWEQAQGKGVIP